jgi:hypothetical protein
MFHWQISKNEQNDSVIILNINLFNRIGGVIVSMLASNAVDHGFDFRSGQTKGWMFA